MSPRPLVVAVAVLAVLAGCSGLTPGDGGAETPEEHPWRGETLVVSLDAPAGEYDRYEPLLRQALSYWEDNAAHYAFPVSFELRPNASDAEADINVDVVDTIHECGNEDYTAGCTLQSVEPGSIPDTAEFEIRNDLSKSSTVDVMEHELGHLLGLDHGDEPRGVMNARFEAETRDRPNVTDRAVPWNRTTLRVHVDLANVSADRRGAVDRQVAHALAYYEDGADGTVPDNVSLRRVDSRAGADILVTVTPADACPGVRPICVTLDGTNVDRDDAVEFYTRQTVTVAGVDTDATGWYVARALAPGLGLTDVDDLPPALSGDSSVDRRGEWWE